MFNWLGKLLSGRTAIEERRRNPVLQAAINQSALVYQGIPLRKYIDERRRNNLARQLYLELDSICNARDPAVVCRDRFANTMLQLAAYQVLVIPPEPEEDLSGLRGQPGVTGELGNHVSDLFKKNDDLRSALFGKPDGESDQDVQVFVSRTYWETYWLLETLDAARIELGDSIPNDDWKRAFLHAACVNIEHIYRRQLELPSAFKDSAARDAPMAYSMFTDIVMSGSKEPAAEWRDYYRNSTVPMPDFARPLFDED